jgi:hypothetical protein
MFGLNRLYILNYLVSLTLRKKLCFAWSTEQLQVLCSFYDSKVLHYLLCLLYHTGQHFYFLSSDSDRYLFIIVVFWNNAEDFPTTLYHNCYWHRILSYCLSLFEFLGLYFKWHIFFYFVWGPLHSLYFVFSESVQVQGYCNNCPSILCTVVSRCLASSLLDPKLHWTWHREVKIWSNLVVKHPFKKHWLQDGCTMVLHIVECGGNARVDVFWNVLRCMRSTFHLYWSPCPDS